jgi:hypothetical protein
MERIGNVDYSRQESMDSQLLSLYKERTHIIVGTGGIGFWVGILLAMMGCRYFILIDGDKIEPTNLSRLPVPQSMVGFLKVNALKRIIRFLRPDTLCISVPRHILKEEARGFINSLVTKYYIQMNGGAFVWDTTDDARVQKQLYLGTANYIYTKVGYEGFKVGAYGEYDVWINEETYAPGYRTTEANAVSSVLAAAMGIFHGLYRRETFKKDLNLDVRELLTKEEANEPVANR